MMQQQANKLVRRQIIAVAVHAADAVGVAVGHKADVVRMLPQERLAARVILNNRLGIDAAEQDVMPPVERCDFAGRAGKNCFKTTRADAEQRVVREAQF